MGKNGNNIINAMWTRYQIYPIVSLSDYIQTHWWSSYTKEFELKKAIFGVSKDSNNMAIIIIGICIWGEGDSNCDFCVFVFLSFSKWDFYENYLK